LPVLALLCLAIAGCAAARLHDEGINLVDRGQVEAGLAKLAAAAKSDPENFSYRIDLIQTRTRIVNRLLRKADSRRSAGQYDDAADLYRRVLQIDAQNPRAKAGLDNIAMDRRHAATLVKAKALFAEHDLDRAQHLVRSILLEDPEHREAKILQRKIAEAFADNAVAGPALLPEFKRPVTLEFRDANLKMVVEALSRASGLNIILDKDVRGDLKTTIFVKDASVEDTIDLIAMQNELNKKILSSNTVLLYPDTPAKVKEYQDLMIRSFQLTNADAKHMEKMVKTLLKTKDLYVDEKTNSLVMRDTPDAVRLAEKLIASQDLAEPEVMLEVEVLEVTRARLTELGIKLPEQIALSASGTPSSTTVNTLPGGGVVTNTTPSQPLTLRDLNHLNSSYFTVSSLNAAIDLKDESGDVNILASPRIRVRNHEKAKILIGDRVPVITNAVTPVSTGSPVVTGNVQYLDVGLKLNVQPYIHPDDDVEIKVDLEVSNIVREISSGPTLAYQIGTRSANTVLRLKDGETQVLAGLINDEDRKSAQKFPGLGDLPILGRLFSSHKNDKKKTEIVLSITPHLTRRNQRPDASDTEFWSGTDGNLRSRPITLEPTRAPKAHAATSPASAHPRSATTASKSDATTDDNTAAPAAAKADQSTGLYPPVPVEPSDNNTGSTGNATDAPAPLGLDWSGPHAVKVGDQFQVVLRGDARKPVSNMSFTVDYDPKAMTVMHIAEGKLLKQNGKKTVFTSKIDPGTGRAFFYMSRLAPQGATGKGSLAVLTFSARKAVSNSAITIDQSKVVGSGGTALAPAHAQPMLVTLKP